MGLGKNPSWRLEVCWYTSAITTIVFTLNELVFCFTADMKSNTLPINVSQIQLRFFSSATATQVSPMRQAQLGVICDAVVTCTVATTVTQPVPITTSPVVGKSTSSPPPVCLAFDIL